MFGFFNYDGSSTGLIVSIFLTGVTMLALALGRQLWLATKGILRSLPELKNALRQLLEWGADTGFVVIIPRGTKYFVQFKSYILRDGRRGMEMSFPKADWSKQFFGRLQQYCDANGVGYEIRIGENDPMSFLVVDCQTDIDRAHDLIKAVVGEIFGLNVDRQYHVTFYDLASKKQEL